MSDVCSDYFFFFKQKTAYEIPKRDWSSDVCSSDLVGGEVEGERVVDDRATRHGRDRRWMERNRRRPETPNRNVFYYSGNIVKIKWGPERRRVGEEYGDGDGRRRTGEERQAGPAPGTRRFWTDAS